MLLAPREGGPTGLVARTAPHRHPTCFVFLFRYEVVCRSSELAKDILVPSFDPKNKHCVFQGDLLLFSCAGAHPGRQRICPCRDFIKGQVALCEDCL